jgi:tryptophan-rich sensory protein
MKKWIVLGLFIALCVGTGALAGYATQQSVSDWYLTLNRPDWTPPSWLFAPVWTTLYVMMAIAAWLVWQTWPQSAMAMIVFFVQLTLNLAWSFLFFGARSPILGLVDIAALWLAIVLTIVLFNRHSRAAGLLLVPYLAWVSFAAALNFTIWQMN